MSKRVIYIAFWDTEVEELINHLKQTNGNQDLIDKLEFMVLDHVKV